MVAFLFADNPRSTLGASAGPSQTTLTLSAGGGALFPSPGAGQAFALTLNDLSTRGRFEVCYCTARSGDVLTVTRGEEGTAAQSWGVGDYAWNGPTSGQMANMVQTPFMYDGSISPLFGSLSTLYDASIGRDETVGRNLVVQGDATARGSFHVGYSGQVYWVDNGSSQLLNFAGGQYLQFIPGNGFVLNTGGHVQINAPGGTNVSNDFGAGGNVSGNGIYGYYVHSNGDINADGNVHVNGSATVNGRVLVNNGGGGPNGSFVINAPYPFVFSFDTDDADNWIGWGQGFQLKMVFALSNYGWFVFYRPDGLGLWYSDYYGNFHVAGNVYAANVSDERTKKNVEPFMRGLDAISALEPVSWQYNGSGGTADDGRVHYGVTAQQARPHIPEAVFNTPEHRDPKSENKAPLRLPDQLSVDDKPILMALVNSVKELSAIVQSLSSRVDALERLA